MSAEFSGGRRIVRRQRGVLRRIAGSMHRLKSFDRRRAARFILTPPASCVFSSVALGGQQEYVCKVCNISETGALIMTDEVKLMPGNDIIIRFGADDSGGLVEMAGEVFRTYRKKAQLRYYSAIRFNEGEVEKIRRYLKKITATG